MQLISKSYGSGNNKKFFDNQNKDSTSMSTNYIPTFDKLALKAFNQLSCHWEINRLLVASYLLNFLDHYFQKKMLK